MRVEIEWRPPPAQTPRVLALLDELPSVGGDLAYLERSDGSFQIVPKAMLEAMSKMPFAVGADYYERALPTLKQAQEYAEDILRAHIEDFDGYSVRDRAIWVIETVKRLNNVGAAIEELGEYVTRAKPGSTTRKLPIKDADRAVWAAILKDVHRLSSLQIGERLGIPGDPDRREAKGENQNANTAVARGREILHRAFTDEGWQEMVKRMRAARTQPST